MSEMSMGNHVIIKKKRDIFKLLECVLILIGICGLVFCSLFFIMNQININSAYRDLSNCSVSQVKERVEYIKDLSEAQAAASTKDIISLLYGFLSSAFIAIGLHFLKESQQATKDTKVFADDVSKKHKKICDYYKTIYKNNKKIIEITENASEISKSVEVNYNVICDYYNKILEKEKEISKILDFSNKELIRISINQEEQSHSILFQTYIERAIISCHFIELLTLMSSGLQLFDAKINETSNERKSDIIGVIYRVLPRIRDALKWTADYDMYNYALTSTSIYMLLRGINEIEFSLKAIIQYRRDIPDLEEFNGTWEEFLDYCNLIKKNLKSSNRI